MKRIFLILGLFTASLASAQTKAENIIVITTDGFRWQEVFGGMDSVIANNGKFNQGDSAGIFKQYWSNDALERREKLLPFLTKFVGSKGQLYGNRWLDSRVDNANPYWFSYPGYNEIMTGYPDTTVNSNDFPPNPNENVLAFLNRQPGIKGRVAAYGAWDAFDRILNEKRSGFPVTSSFDHAGGDKPTAAEQLINKMKDQSYKPFGMGECLDVFTHYSAMDYLKNKKPRVLYISYGETDEWAHEGRYRDYLNAAHQVDEWIKEIWQYVQSDPQYRNKTAILITTDHGRGDIKKEEWTSHNNSIADSYQIWFGVMGPGVSAKGVVKGGAQLYQQQFAQTIAKLLGKVFKTDHPVAPAVDVIWK